MSLDFGIAPYCPGKYCTNKLTSMTEYNNNLCDCCMFEDQEQHKKEKEEKLNKEEE